jgi:hypothetical protein
VILPLATVACGEESLSIVGPVAEAGNSKTIGRGGITGPGDGFTICRRLKTEMLPSPNSKTKRD